MLKRLENKPQTTLCELCKEAQATLHCQNCPADLCKSCFDCEHKKSIIASKHVPIPLLNKMKCGIHNNSKKDFFCFRDQEIVCALCHDGHEGQLLKDHCESIRTSLHNTLTSTPMNELSQSLSSMIMSLGLSMSEIESSCVDARQTVIETVNSMIEELTRVLEERRVQMFKQIEDHNQNFYDKIYSAREEISLALAELETVYVYIKQTFAKEKGGRREGEEDGKGLEDVGKNKVTEMGMMKFLQNQMEKYMTQAKQCELKYHSILHQTNHQTLTICVPSIASQIQTIVQEKINDWGDVFFDHIPFPPQFTHLSTDSTTVTIRWAPFTPPPPSSTSPFASISSKGSSYPAVQQYGKQPSSSSSPSPPSSPLSLSLPCSLSRYPTLVSVPSSSLTTSTSSSPVSPCASSLCHRPIHMLVDEYELEVRILSCDGLSRYEEKSENAPEWKQLYFGHETAYRQCGLQPNSTIEYRVRAHNRVGWGQWRSVIVHTKQIRLIGTGTEGSGDAQFNCPWGIAIFDNLVYVADCKNHRIQVFDQRTGQFIRKFGTKGDGKGQFNEPVGVAVYPMDNELFVADNENHRIQVFERKNFSFRRSFGTKGDEKGHFNKPWLITIENDELYVADHINNRIQVLNCRDGRFIRQYGMGVPGINDGFLSRPNGIAVSKNEVFVSENGNDRIQVFNRKTGQFIRKFGCEGDRKGQFNGPNGLAIHNNQLFVADRSNHRIQIFDCQDGSFIRSFGSCGVGKGQFNSPVVLCFSGNELYVGECGCDRIQIFYSPSETD